MQRKLIWKLVTVLSLSLLSLIPLAMVRGVVIERQMLRDGVIRDLQEQTVGPQRLAGPVLVVPYTKRVIEIDREKRDGTMLEIKRIRYVSGKFHFLPEELDVRGTATPEERRRGIYKAMAYKGQWSITGRFELPPRLGIGDDFESYRFGQAQLVLGVNDPRGLDSEMSMQWSGTPVVPQAGAGEAGLSKGVHVDVALGNVSATAPRTATFSWSMKLAGLNNMTFIPTGRVSSVSLKSPWPHPSFFGPLLAEHSIDENGFGAHWKSSWFSNNLDRVYASCFEKQQCHEFDSLAYGVSLIKPVDVYQLLERSVKYGLLFIGLTFIVFFLFDVLKSTPVHPVQYGLVGGSLVIFYLLVTSLSEHISFGLAYMMGSVACICLIGYYLASVLRSWWRGASVALMLGSLYAVLYVILLSEDHALLMGSVLLFALMAMIMIGTRKVDWYQISSKVLPSGNEIDEVA